MTGTLLVANSAVSSFLYASENSYIPAYIRAIIPFKVSDIQVTIVTQIIPPSALKHHAQ